MCARWITSILLLGSLYCVVGIEWNYNINQWGDNNDNSCFVITVDINSNVYTALVDAGSTLHITKFNSKGEITADYNNTKDAIFTVPTEMIYHTQSNLIIASYWISNVTVNDGLLIALSSSDLSLVWEWRTPTNNYDAFISVVTDPTNSSQVIAIGTTEDVTSFYGPAVDFSDVLFMKLEAATGNVVSKKRIGTSNETAVDVAFLQDGTFFVATCSYTNCSLHKCNPAGDLVWTYPISFTIQSIASVSNSSHTSIFLVGKNYTMVVLGAVADLGTSAQELWTQTLSQGDGSGLVYNTQLDQLYAIGYSDRSQFLGINNTGPVGQRNVFLVGFTQSGEIIYKDFFGTDNPDDANYLTLDPHTTAMWICGATDGNFGGSGNGFSDYYYLKAAQPTHSSDKASNLGVILGVSLGLGLPMVGGIVVIACCIKRKRDSEEPSSAQSSNLIPYRLLMMLDEGASNYSNLPGGRQRASSSKRSFSKAKENDWVINYKQIDLQKKLGKGAFGEVYKGRWRGTYVAVKQMLAEDPESVSELQIQDFFTEAELMKKLRPHPNITQLLGVCNDPLCIVLEFVPNGSLYSWLHSEKQMDNELKLHIVKGIAAGMLHLHSEGVIHRDLAARNILLDENLNPKVSDFGMSRVALDNKTNKTEADVGPVKWMAPEALTKRIYNTKTDVWSFGVVVYEVLARKRPYHDYHVMNVATNVALGGLSLIPDLEKEAAKRDFPDVLVTVCKQCLQFDPADRPDMKDCILLKE